MIRTGGTCAGFCSEESISAALAMLCCRLGEQIPTFFILLIRVVGFTPTLAAAPFAPPTTQSTSTSVFRIRASDQMGHSVDDGGTTKRRDGESVTSLAT